MDGYLAAKFNEHGNGLTIIFAGGGMLTVRSPKARERFST